MQYRILQSILVSVMVVGISGCTSITGQAEKKEAPGQQVSLRDITMPARETIEKLTAGGEIKKIEREVVDGKVIYDVEARVGDKDVEYDVDFNGAILTFQESVEYATLPGAVKAVAQKYFGSSTGLKAAKEVEGGKTFYEVEGKKDSTTVTLKLTDTGQITEEEK